MRHFVFGVKQIDIRFVKSKIIELDVDFIGGQGSLTKDEEKQISEFMRSQKLMRDKKQIRKSGIKNENTV